MDKEKEIYWAIINRHTCACIIPYLRFSELNSDSRNLRNCSLPTGSFKTSSMPKAHLLTLCWPGSLLPDKEAAKVRAKNKHWATTSRKIKHIHARTHGHADQSMNLIQFHPRVQTWLPAPTLWRRLWSRGWRGPEVWGRGRIPHTAPCRPANCHKATRSMLGWSSYVSHTALVS